MPSLIITAQRRGAPPRSGGWAPRPRAAVGYHAGHDGRGRLARRRGWPVGSRRGRRWRPAAHRGRRQGPARASRAASASPSRPAARLAPIHTSPGNLSRPRTRPWRWPRRRQGAAPDVDGRGGASPLALSPRCSRCPGGGAASSGRRRRQSEPPTVRGPGLVLLQAPRGLSVYFTVHGRRIRVVLKPSSYLFDLEGRKALSSDLASGLLDRKQVPQHRRGK